MDQETLALSDMHDCIEACRSCHDTCLAMAMNHCLELGGKHVAPEHFKLMMNCAEICQTSLNFMLSDSTLRHSVCAVCAEVCEACALSCERVGQMNECIKACNLCAEKCRQMAGNQMDLHMHGNSQYQQPTTGVSGGMPRQGI